MLTCARYIDYRAIVVIGLDDFISVVPGVGFVYIVFVLLGHFVIFRVRFVDGIRRIRGTV